MVTRRTPTALEQIITQLRTLTESVAQAEAGVDPNAIKRARQALDAIATKLSAHAVGLDPVLRPGSIFDPTDPKTAGRVVALTLVAQDKHPLAEIPNFYGAGVYAIYYRGAFEAYTPLSGTDHPIYVGKADPESQAAKDAVGQGNKLFGRLSEHAKNIARATSTLDVADFDCRFLVVQTGFQTAAEDYLIDFFKPIWNSETRICHGLGKHGDNAGTRGNKRSPWDTIHPGRPWATATAENQFPPEVILTQIAAHLTRHPPYADLHAVFDHFMAHMRQIPRRAPPLT